MCAQLEEDLAFADGRGALAEANRIVVKVGTRVLSGGGHLVDQEAVGRLVDQLAPLHGDGREVLLVSSGAVGLGAEALGFDEPPVGLEDRQACAAVGQARLMRLYKDSFRRFGIVCAQVLLTESDFESRKRYLNLRATLDRLLRLRVMPIINENDTVSVDELVVQEQEGRRPVFGDNDRLSALVATKLGAGLLVLVTDVEGVYDRDPRVDAEARLLSRVDAFDEAPAESQAGPAAWGRGGIRTKIEAAQIAARSGCHAVVVSGRPRDGVATAAAGADVGTWFPARAGLDARRRWIAFAARAQAQLYLDDGAVRALEDGRSSLLAAGVRRIEGRFRRGEVVQLMTESGKAVGRGMASCDLDTARLWGAGERRVGVRSEQPLIRRDRLVLEEWVDAGARARRSES